MSARENYTGAHVRSLSPLHHTERGTPVGSLKLFLWDVAAVLGAVLLLVVTAASILFSLFILLFGNF